MSRLLTHLVPLCGALTVVLIPRLANADCDAANPCPDGFICETVTADVACPAIACAEGEDCELPECTAQEYSYCAPEACDPDGAADQCGADMVCFSYESGMCGGATEPAPDCAEGEDCTTIEPDRVAECTTTVESYCAYKHTLPCVESADCGEGFECTPYEITSCSGSAGMGTTPSSGAGTGGASGSGDAAPADPAVPLPVEEEKPVEESCTTELSEEKYCKVIEVTCETDAECLEGWTCQDVGDTAVSSCGSVDPSDPGPTPDGTEPAGAGGAEADGGAAEPMESTEFCVAQDPVEVEKKCAPPGYEYGYGGVSTAGEHDSSTTGGVDENGVPVPESPRDPSGEPSVSGSGNPSANAADGDQNADSSSGCSLGGPLGSAPTPSNAGLIGLLLGLVTLGLRRKR